MSKISIAGASTGTATFTIESPATSTNRTLTLPDNTGTIITQNSTPAFASTIGVGGATAAASGAGITFPATQSASSDANTLDDYEEGTWTPGIGGTGTLGTASYGAREGVYTKIGNLVTVQFIVDYSGANGTGSLAITGLPFGSTKRTTGAVMTENIDWTSGTSPVLYSNNGDTFFIIYVSGDNVGWSATPVDAAGTIIGSCTYRV